jgi:N utilization substance protein A
LTGYKINVFSDVDHNEDVLLEDFSDEIDGWIIDEFKKVGYDTAKSVLKADFNLLVKQTDLEEETIREVVKILKSEFE